MEKNFSELRKHFVKRNAFKGQQEKYLEKVYSTSIHGV